jgi:prepilin-type processing-associated H-X9-DG protein/prepilin-type N-terminal cleavage/methylation domain-containing protein
MIQPSKKISPAFTLTELLVVIAIVGGLAALLMPAVKSASLSAKSAKAISNLKQTGIIVGSYAADNGNRLPLSMYWPSQFTFQKILRSYSKELQAMPIYKSVQTDLPEIFFDPVLKGKKEHSYGSFGVNSAVVFDNNKVGGPDGVGMAFAIIASPSQKVIYCSAIEPGVAGTWGFNGNAFVEKGFDPTYGPDPRHGGKAVALFADGHVEKLDVKNMDEATRRRHFTLDP